MANIVSRPSTKEYREGWERTFTKTRRDVNKMECACGGTTFKETELKDHGNPVYECVDCGALCVD